MVSALGGGLLLLLLVYVPGWIVCTADPRADGFSRTWWGLALTSLAGLGLAQAGWFSLVALAGVLAVTSVLGAAVGRRVHAPDRPLSLPALRSDAPAVRGLACVAALTGVLWCSPPFETFLAGADSTMYVDAGVHLARTGTLAVRDTASAILGERTARAIFPSVRLAGGGPYIRLPGGLLMRTPTSTESIPAFFPLVPVWSGIASGIWGPEAAPVAAPLFAGLAVWALTLLVGEAFGLAAAAVVAGLLLANFSLWWFGRFLMPELLTAAFVWGGLAFLRRGAPLGAGAMLGMGGIARAETLPFIVGAGLAWVAWTKAARAPQAFAEPDGRAARRARPQIDLPPLLAGFAPPLAVTILNFVRMPSHHLAYLQNDVVLTVMQAWRRGPVMWSAALVVIVAVLGAILGVLVRRGGSRAPAVARVVSLLAIVVATVLYAWIGGALHPLRSLGWLAAYCSWPVLAFAAVGGVIVWRRGDPALRLAVLLWVVVAVIFVLNPRVSTYQPWAIRRFLPIVIPGIVAAAAVAVAQLARVGRRRTPVVLVALALAMLEVRPVLAVWRKPFFQGSFESVAAISAMVPRDAVLLIDSELADVQVQVPLWLVHGRETVMLKGGTSNWREAMYALTASGRPTYWVANALLPPPKARVLALTPLESQPELVLLVADATADAPPARMIRKRVPLRLYRVERAVTSTRGPRSAGDRGAR